MALAAVFLYGWVAPTRLGAAGVRYLVLLVLFEFFVVHSSALLGTLALQPGPAGKKHQVILALTVLYTLFLGGFALSVHEWWPLLVFWGLTLNRLLPLLLGDRPTAKQKALLEAGWGTCAAFYVLMLLPVVVLPIPHLGITREIAGSLDLPGGGAWADEPHRAVAFGFLYFTAVALVTPFNHRWVARLPAGASAPAPAVR